MASGVSGNRERRARSTPSTASGNPDAAYSDDGVSETVPAGPAEIDGVWRSGGRLFVTTFNSGVTVHINALTI